MCSQGGNFWVGVVVEIKGGESRGLVEAWEEGEGLLVTEDDFFIFADFLSTNETITQK